MALELLFLGTGTSAGVPMIGCDCAVCRSPDPRDQRSRPSVLVSYPDLRPDNPAHLTPLGRPADGAAPRPRRFLIDTAPELRLQMLRHRIHQIDGVFYTHAHADHIFGIDDLRRFNVVMDAPLDIYGEAETLATIRQTFFYIFEPHKNVNQSFVASLLARPVEAGVGFDLAGARWTPLRLLHGRLPILGYRVDYLREGAAATDGGQSASGHGRLRGSEAAALAVAPPARPVSLAYCTDLSSIPPETFPLMEGLDVLVIDALRYRHHPTHLTVDQALELIERVRPKQAYLTHMAHDICHAELEPKLPAGVFLPYDGLCVRVGGAAS